MSNDGIGQEGDCIALGRRCTGRCTCVLTTPPDKLPQISYLNSVCMPDDDTSGSSDDGSVAEEAAEA